MDNGDPQPPVYDRELLKLAQAPNVMVARAAFTAIWKQYDTRLKGWIAECLDGRRTDTDAVLGALSCSFWNRLRTPPPLELTTAKDLWPYLRQAASNQVASYFRDNPTRKGDISLDAEDERAAGTLPAQPAKASEDEQRLSAYSLLLLSQRAQQGAQASGELLQRLEMSPEQVGEAQARAAEWFQNYGVTCFLQALRQLSQNSRDILILRCHFDLSTREVGKILDISESAVDNRVLQAKRRLRDIFASVLHDAGFSYVQIWHVLVSRRKLWSTLKDADVDDETRARRVREMIDSGRKLRGKTKE